MKDLTNEFPSAPKSKFSCPISPYILWFHGLIFKECPVACSERDMPSCSKCSLRGEIDTKIKQKSDRNNRNKDRKDGQNTNKRPKDSIPKIGKTYISE